MSRKLRQNWPPYHSNNYICSAEFYNFTNTFPSPMCKYLLLFRTKCHGNKSGRNKNLWKQPTATVEGKCSILLTVGQHKNAKFGINLVLLSRGRYLILRGIKILVGWRALWAVGGGETLHGHISYLITGQRAAIGGEYSARHNPERRPALRRILDRGELGEGSRRLSAYCVQYVNVVCRQLRGHAGVTSWQ